MRRGTRRSLATLLGLTLLGTSLAAPAAADLTVQSLPFAQDWSDTNMITTANDWSGVPGIIGYRGDGMTGTTGVDPQTVLADGSHTPVNVIANQTNPNTLTTGGVAEFHIADPVVALQGSGTARAPHIVISINTTGRHTINVSYNLRDIDGSADNAIQPVALHYRVGDSGNYTNIPAAFVADATTGPNEATLVTPVSVTLPTAAENQSLVQLRIMTTDAAGSDEWVGIDDISISGTLSGDPTDPTGVGGSNPSSVLAGQSSLLTVTVTPGSEPPSTGLAVTADLSAIGGSSAQDFFDDGTNGDVTAGDNIFSFLATVDPATPPGTKSMPATITDAQSRTGNATIPLTIKEPAAVVISEFRFRGPQGGNDEFVEIYNRSASQVNIGGWKLRGSNAAGTVGDRATIPVGTLINPGCYFLFFNTAAGGYSGSVPGDQGFGTGIVDQGGIALTMGDNTIVDQVGLSEGSAFKEGTPLPHLGTTTASNLDRGYERKPGGTAGNGTDTDDNSADFHLLTPSNPQNSSSTCIPTGATNPAGVGAADPSTVGVGSNTLLTVDVQPGFNPTSTGLAVTANLSSIGGSASQPFFDDGSNGDATSGDNVFSFEATVDPATASGFKSLPVTITDNEGRTGTTSIGLTVSSNCGDPFTPTWTIQGSGAATTMAGPRTTEGVVIGDFEGPAPNLRGFYIQAIESDDDPTTSDGLFVFNFDNDSVDLGDHVRVSGNVTEFQDQTQITASALLTCATGLTIDPTPVTFPVPEPDGGVDYLERYEGMLVSLPQTMYVTEHFQLGRFGQVTVSSGDRLFQPTNVVAPGAPAAVMQAANDLNRIIVDDDLQNQNPDPLLFGRHGNPLSASNTLRGGDTVTGLVGVMTYTWAGDPAGPNAWRVRPIGALGGGVPDFQPANERPASAPSVGGTLQVSAFNLLNYFNTFGRNNCTGGVEGAAMDCRGADNANEFNRQVGKTVPAVLGLDAHVLGVIEIENDGYGLDSAIADLVDRLNAVAGPGTYAFIDADAGTGELNALGTDAIKVGLLYQPAFVTPVGQTAVLNTVEFVNGGDGAPRNRPTLVQAFADDASDEIFIVSVHHLKSKGSACEEPDAGDGQANCNQVRVNAVNELLAWLDTDPTGTGDPDVLIIGDLNSYAREDPIVALEAAGYTNLIPFLHGSHTYSFAFDGQWGNLDHAMATPSLVGQVTGAAEWYINSDEPNVLDYNTNFKSAAQHALFYAPDQFRSSDHDPVLIGLDLGARADRHVTGSGSIVGATFEFVAMQRQPGPPTGNTTVTLAGGPTFTSTGYHWLKTEASAASYAGIGELDGVAGHSFLVSMTDGGSPGSKDRIRIRIWQTAGGAVVFDSQPGDAAAAAPTSPLTSGNLVVQRTR